MNYFVEIFLDGKWKRTYWTTSSDARPRPVKSRTKAAECLREARKRWPKEKYRIAEVGK